MTPEDANQLWKQVQENHKTLDSCAGPHVFVDQTPERAIGKKFRCSACGGTADGVARHWYERGLVDGAAGPCPS